MFQNIGELIILDLPYFRFPLEEQFGWPSEQFWRQDGKKLNTSVQPHKLTL
jgi:hypothetical protein